MLNAVHRGQLRHGSELQKTYQKIMNKATQSGKVSKAVELKRTL
jgi:hypothetical protein